MIGERLRFAQTLMKIFNHLYILEGSHHNPFQSLRYLLEPFQNGFL